MPLLVVEVLFEFVDLAFQDLVLGAVPFDVLCRALCLLQLLLCLFEVGFEVGDAVLERDDLLVFGHQLVLELLVGCLGSVGSNHAFGGGGGVKAKGAGVRVLSACLVLGLYVASLERISGPVLSPMACTPTSDGGTKREREVPTRLTLRRGWHSGRLRCGGRRGATGPSVSLPCVYAAQSVRVRCVRVDDGVVDARSPL